MSISGGPTASLEGLYMDLRAIEQDDSIKNVILSMDSPGGQVTGVAEFSQYLRNFSKPVYGFGYGYVASAMYWIGSSTTKLYGAPTAEFGSIGTVAVYMDTSARDEKNGVKRFEIVSNLSENKRLDPQSDAGREAELKILDQITELFVADVATGRKTTSQNVLDKFGRGKMFIASEAKELGMIDGIKTLNELVTELNSNNNYKQEVGMSVNVKKASEETPTVVSTAAELKTADSTLYEAIVAEGIKQERERAADIASLKTAYPDASAFIDKHMNDEGMDKGKMAILVLENQENIKKTALKNITSSGSKLADDILEVPSASDQTDEDGTQDDGSEDDKPKLNVAAAVRGAKSAFRKIHNTNMGDK